MQFLIPRIIGLIFSSASLLGGVISFFPVPVQQVFAVILLHERSTFEKGNGVGYVNMGFASYLYNEYNLSHKKASAKNKSNDEAV